MADNIAVTPGTGATVRADEVGSALLQVIKIGLGADGAEDLLLDSGQQTSANSLPVVLPSDQVVDVVGLSTRVGVVLTTTTDALTAGEVVADTQEIANVMRENAGTGLLHSLSVVDKDDQGAALTLFFLNSSASLGTENSTPSIGDSDAETILGWVDVSAADYKDLGGVRVASVKNVGLGLQSGAATTSIYVAVTTSGTPTYATSGLELYLHVLRD